MINDVVKYVKLLARYQITQNQYLALYLVYIRGNKIVKLYNKNMPEPLLDNDAKEDLIRRGFLETTNRGKIKLGTKGKELFLDKYQASDEAWSVYPAFSVTDNKTFPLKGVDKMQFADIYWKAYKGSHDEHRTILDDIEYGERQGLINMRIDNFFSSETYRDLRKMRRHLSDDNVDEETNISDFNEF